MAECLTNDSSFRAIDVAMCASGQITSNFLTQASWRFYMRSDDPQLSVYNLQLPHKHDHQDFESLTFRSDQRKETHRVIETISN